MEGNPGAGRHTQADGRLRAQAACHAVVVDAVLVGQLAAAAMAGKRGAFVEQALQGALVEGVALALAHDRAVAGEAKRGQGGQLLVDGTGHGARGVDVFDAHPPLPAGVPGEQPAAQRGEQRAGVQGAGGRGREAAAVGGHGHEL